MIRTEKPASRPRPVFIAALPREIASLVAQKGWRAIATQLGRGIHLYEHEDAVVACAGMGASRASLAVEAGLSQGDASELISVGWAGACDHALKVGAVVRPGIVIDARTGERFFICEPAETELPQIVVTVASPASVIDKQRLALSYLASAVDMEAAAIARIARARGIAFDAIKAISDDADFEMPDLEEFSTARGQIRELAFGLHVALSPTLWKPVLTMAKGSKLAAERLRAEIEAYIQLRRDRHS